MGNATNDSTSRLLTAVREAQNQALRLDDPHEHARARARLLQAVDRVEAGERPAVAVPSSGGRWGWRLAIGTVAAAACAFALLLGSPDERSLEFEVDGVELSSKAPIVAGQHARMLSFSDRTSIELAPGGRMYVEDLRPNGASVVLEHGEVALAVHHEHDTSWQVAAGPYSVHVTGTQFEVAWEPTAERFAVEVSEGSVRVDGPEGQIASLRAGDSLVRERGKATIEPETLEAQPSEVESERAQIARADEPEGSPEQPGETEEAVDRAGKVDKHKLPSWSELFADADYDAAWQALDELPGGVHGEAAGADADTLLDLADLARFTKHRDDSRKLLEQLRERFPGSDEAAEAAFTLGRLAADGGSQAKAATYFELYLDELPNGSLVGDALGRLMAAYEALGRSSDAASAAERYLARFPKGPHADKAQNILGG